MLIVAAITVTSYQIGYTTGYVEGGVKTRADYQDKWLTYERFVKNLCGDLPLEKNLEVK
jgi:hypothetical protein